MNERCGTCRRWRADEDQTTDTAGAVAGTCRALLPLTVIARMPEAGAVQLARKPSAGGLAIARVEMTMQVQSYWPPCHSEGWCAQYRPVLPWLVRAVRWFIVPPAQ